MIETTKKEVEGYYNMEHGFAHDAKVIYGDTDSVMVKFGTKDLKEAMEWGSCISVSYVTQNIEPVTGADAAARVTAKFTKPIKLEFEKVYFPYLLISKKRYAGLYWTKPESYDKMDSKGIEVSFHYLNIR